jgi:hypothetical protein
MAVKSASKQSATFGTRLRKTKFQADLAPAEDRMVRALKGELQLNSNTGFSFRRSGIISLGGV